MKNSNLPDEALCTARAIIRRNCLPEDSVETVLEIVSEEDAEESRENLAVFTAHCYRFEPNHPRYNKNRSEFPAL